VLYDLLYESIFEVEVTESQKSDGSKIRRLSSNVAQLSNTGHGHKSLSLGCWWSKIHVKVARSLCQCRAMSSQSNKTGAHFMYVTSLTSACSGIMLLNDFCRALLCISAAYAVIWCMSLSLSLSLCVCMFVWMLSK